MQLSARMPRRINSASFKLKEDGHLYFNIGGN